MTLKSFAEAQRHKGGFKKWVYETIKSLNDSAYDDTALKGRVKDVEDAIGDEDTAETILYRIKALETAASGSSGSSGSGGGGGK